MPRPKMRNDQLKRRLLSESMALLQSHGPGAVTARRVATVAGTSTAAVYELFGNKSGLVRSIFYEAFSHLANVLYGLEPTGDERDDLLVLFEATRRFALQFPMLFEVMFARPFTEFKPGPDDFEAADRIYRHVIRRVAALLGTHDTDRLTVDAAHALVALDRGLIAAELNGILGTSAQSIDRRRKAALTAIIAGLQAQAVRS